MGKIIDYIKTTFANIQLLPNILRRLLHKFMNIINNVKWDLSKHGDPLEQEYYLYIEEKLNVYINIWEKYIGNEYNYPPKVKGLSNEQDVIRYKLAELNYTILENIISLNEILKEYSNIETDNKRILKANRDIKTIFTTTSNIFDCLQHILVNIKKDKDKIEVNYCELKKYILDRNTVLHNKKIPINISDGILYIPKEINDEFETGINKKWNEYTSLDFIPLYMYLTKLIQETELVILSVLQKEYSFLNENFKNMEFQTPNISKMKNVQISGLTESFISINTISDNLRQ